MNELTSKEIVELLCELVDLKELTNRGLILKDINNFQNQLEKDLEVFEILKNKKVDVKWLETTKTLKGYNNNLLVDRLTEEEFNLLKEGLEK